MNMEKKKKEGLRKREQNWLQSGLSKNPPTNPKIRAHLFDPAVWERFVMQRKNGLILQPRQEYFVLLTERLNDAF
ncbi:unnamed protein product [Angiostrongylus costaricensis]|uniref:Site-specific DNA-methyltransferase (adenine-specific) n=1 Tax=Angiostrongylus costaricensis TaxID=334426 RepID=A0A0R3PGL1_ANGCS|nr:unnamed protein product [Angiostrongylus costaricensis]